MLLSNIHWLRLKAAGLLQYLQTFIYFYAPNETLPLINVTRKQVVWSTSSWVIVPTSPGNAWRTVAASANTAPV